MVLCLYQWLLEGTNGEKRLRQRRRRLMILTDQEIQEWCEVGKMLYERNIENVKLTYLFMSTGTDPTGLQHLVLLHLSI